MGCLIFQDEISNFFQFGREKWPIFKILATNHENRIAVHHRIALSISCPVFRVISTTFWVKHADFTALHRSKQERYVHRQSCFGGLEGVCFHHCTYFTIIAHIGNFSLLKIP